MVGHCDICVTSKTTTFTTTHFLQFILVVIIVPLLLKLFPSPFPTSLLLSVTSQRSLTIKRDTHWIGCWLPCFEASAA